MPECSVCGEEFPGEELLRCRQCGKAYCETCSELNDDDLCPDCAEKEDEEEEEEGMEDYADDVHEDGSDDFYG